MSGFAFARRTGAGHLKARCGFRIERPNTLMAEGIWRHASAEQPFSDPATLDYRLPDRATTGQVRWLKQLPLNTSDVNLANPTEAIFTLPRNAGWLARSAGDVAPYFSFDLTVPQTNAAQTVQIEPWAFCQELAVYVNNTRVTANQFNSYADYYQSWLFRRSREWASTNGLQLGMVAQQNYNLVTATAVNGGNAFVGGALTNIVVATDPTTVVPSLVTANNAAITQRYVVPLPTDFNVLSNSRSSLPLPHLAQVEVRVKLAGFTSYAQTTAGAALPGLTMKNLELWLPMMAVHPSVDRRMAERMEKGDSDPSMALAIDVSDPEILSQSLVPTAGTYNLIYTCQRQFVSGLEAHFKPSAPAGSWIASGSIRSNLSSYQFAVDGAPTSMFPIQCTDATLEPYVRMLDFTSAQNKEDRDDGYLPMTGVANTRLDALPAAVAPAASDGARLPFFAAVSPMTTPGREGLASDHQLTQVTLMLNRSAASVQCNVPLIVHARSRVIVSAKTCTVLR